MQPSAELGSVLSLLRSLSGKRPTTAPNQPISFDNKQYSKPSEISKAFCKQYTGTDPRIRHANSRNLSRHFKSSHPLNHNLNPFTPDLVQAAIKASGNSTAVGPDKMNILFLNPFSTMTIRMSSCMLPRRASDDDTGYRHKLYASLLFIV